MSNSYNNRQQQPIAIDSGGDSGEEDYKMRRQVNNQQAQPYILKEDEKIPLFLIKLWNIVEDPSYYDVIRWDESGYSFHITDPYSFCRNVLPQYFKHNNLNSLIRQLNMYGFRKMTPIERTSLARAESDQDHLEFSHAYFVRDHPELLLNIKRKVPISKQAHDAVSAGAATTQANQTTTVNVPVKDLSAVFDELRQLRDRQKNMEIKMNDLVKDNEMIWREMDHVRGAHLKQQQIVNKLIQFLVALVQPNKQHRLGKRHLLAIDDEFQHKRGRQQGQQGGSTNAYDSSLQISQASNANEVLDSLISELASGGIFAGNLMRTSRPGSNSSSNGPIIADVTDELDQLTTDALQQQVSQSVFGMDGTEPVASSYSEYVMRKTPPLGANLQQQQQPQRRYPVRSSRQQPQQQQQFAYTSSNNNSNRKPSQAQVQPTSLVVSSQNPPTLSFVQPPVQQQMRQLRSQPQQPNYPPMAAPQASMSNPQMVYSGQQAPMVVSAAPPQLVYNPPDPLNSSTSPMQPSPIVMQPMSNEQVLTSSPLIDSVNNPLTTPPAPAVTDFNPSEFDDYFSNIDHSIKSVHSSIGNQWDKYNSNDNFDFDHLLEGWADDESITASKTPVAEENRPQLSSLNPPTATPIKSPGGR
uniref:HSF-type DNA-binding domain-containing protein n=1 Tax=Ditylenchus dipsaci TaxID=166011 RepID=A0A915DAI8_9BILA